MSAQKIVDAVLKHRTDDARLYIINIANPDMIGHAGDLEAAKKAIEVTDECLRQLVDALTAENAAIIITADHGNAEELIDPASGGNDTQHSTRNVPVLFITRELDGKGDTGRSLESLAQEAPIGTLVDIAPSVLYLLGIEKPTEMTGSRLVSV
jgi:2,3-bisphosphoglycerate-independent phosphoglycerate mutase